MVVILFLYRSISQALFPFRFLSFEICRFWSDGFEID